MHCISRWNPIERRQFLAILCVTMMIWSAAAGAAAAAAVVVVDISRHNSLHYEKTAVVEASAAIVACDQVVQTSPEGYFGSTSRMVAQIYFVGVSTREQIVHIALNTVFSEYCNPAVMATTTTSSSSTGSNSPANHPVTTTTKQPFEAITGFHFGPLESWCDPSTSKALCRSAMTVSVFGESSVSLSTTEALFQYILHEIPSLSPRYSQHIDVISSRTQRRPHSLSWSMAMWIILLVLVVSLLAVWMSFPNSSNNSNTDDPTNVSSSSLYYSKSKSAATTPPATTATWPWDVATIATTTASTKSTSSSSSHASSMYLTSVDESYLSSVSFTTSTTEEQTDVLLATLSRSPPPPPASLLTEKQRLVDWLVPIVGVGKRDGRIVQYSIDDDDDDDDEDVSPSFAFT